LLPPLNAISWMRYPRRSCMRSSRTCFLLSLVLIAARMSAQTPMPATPNSAAPLVAPTPPMGWNSWDAYGLTITEEQFRANVKVLATQLNPLGWNYAVIDEACFFYTPQDRPRPDTLHYAIDTNGRYVPVLARFPSAGSMAAQQPPATGGDGPKLSATIGETSF